MKLIVGLGNPGDKYGYSRHNVGFLLIDKIAEDLGVAWEESQKLKAKIARKDDLLLLKPLEFMNSSGVPVSLTVNFYKVPFSDLLVIHDDVDLSFGEIKKQFASGSAGHKGVESIISNIGSKDFWRIRFGIGRPVNAQSVEDFVLSSFSKKELQTIQEVEIEKYIF